MTNPNFSVSSSTSGFLAAALSLLFLTCVATPVEAGEVTIHVGPPSIGSGGSNPLSIPPTEVVEYELTYLTDKDYEWSLAVTPGILFGSRSETGSGVYVGFGGGLVLSYNGAGPGVYSSFGWNSDKKGWWFNAEVKQAVGFDFGASAMLSPYAIRIGVGFEW